MSAASNVAVVGGGPAGLMAAEVLSAAGLAVTVYDRMPTVGRKLLMAGRGGLNLTHSEPFERFLGRYGDGAELLRPMLDAFPPATLIEWAEGLGQGTFVGSSGRVFPRTLKASPLLRAWLVRLEAQGIVIRTRHEWAGWDTDGALLFRLENGELVREHAAATVLALGGASWPKLGSDGGWAPLLKKRGVTLAPFRPANVGFDVAWSPVFRERFAGVPLKGVALSFAGRTARSDAMVTRYGLEGGAVYSLSRALRDAVEGARSAVLHVDLRPDMPMERLAEKLDRPRAGQSLGNFLRKAAHLAPVAIGLLREGHGRDLPSDPGSLAMCIKAAPVTLVGVQPVERAISTAGGVRFGSVDEDLMLRAAPGTFVAGEMLDWEAPTGGYLLQATFASGVAAANGVLRRLSPPSP